MNDELEEVKVTVIKETDKAVLLMNDGADQSWFPKSQVEFKQRNVHTGIAVAHIPVWLLEKNEW